MFVTQQTAPNTGNFILLVLAVYGAIADSRYIAKGGKKAPKWTTLKLAAAFGLLVVVIGLRDPSPESIGSLAGMFFVIGFAGYEAWRWYIRRKNPLINR